VSEPEAEPGVEADRHRRHPGAAAVAAVTVSAAASCTYGATSAAAVAEGAHIAAVAPRKRVHRVAVVVLDAVMPADRVHDGMTLAAVVMSHRGMGRVLHRMHRAPVDAVVHAGPVGHRAVMRNVMMAAVSSTAHSAAAAPNG
jgi:hypothetical protein